MTGPDTTEPRHEDANERAVPTRGRRRGVLPPKWIRRVVIAPAFVVGAVMLLLAMPLWLIGGAFASRFVPGRWRILRVAWFLFVYLWLEVLALAVLFCTWVASGFGRTIGSDAWQRRHYGFASWWLARVMGSARRTFHLTIDRSIDERIERSPNPVLVFSRHEYAERALEF